jgi:hypothetical protein
MAASRYTPVNVAAAFAAIKATDQTAENNAIKAAFDAIDAFSAVLASMQIGPGGNRNILVDPSTVLGSGNAIVIMMPASPVVGDPPVRVTLLADTYWTGVGNHNSPVYVQGDNTVAPGTPDAIFGTLTNLPRLYDAGDYIELVWIGGTIGWDIVSRRYGLYVPNSVPSASGPNGSAAEDFPFDGLERVVTSADGAVIMHSLHNKVGVEFGIRYTSASGSSISIGNAGGADTVNGVASPFSGVPAAGTYYRVSCIGNRTYWVSILA